jgi:hypothetical protein
MPAREWTVKELIEALKNSRQMQRSTTRWGQTAQEQSAKRNTSRPGASPAKWECYWIDRLLICASALNLFHPLKSGAGRQIAAGHSWQRQ